MLFDHLFKHQQISSVAVESESRNTSTVYQNRCTGAYRLYGHPWDWGTHWFTWNISMLCLL